MAQQLANLTSNHENMGSIPGLEGSGVAVSGELWCKSQMRLGSGVAVAVA